MEENTVRSAQRVFLLLETLARSGTMGITELSIKTGLNKATVFRQINTLVSLGYAQKEEGTDKYKLTLKLLHIASGLLDQMDMRVIVRPYLERLAAQTGETVHLVQREEGYIIYIDKVEPTVNSVRMVSRIGMRQPMYCTAVGKALLADLSEEEVRHVWEHSRILPLTGHTLVEWSGFIREIAAVRQRGYALDNEENELGVCCVAVSLPDHTGKETYAVSISAPISRMSDERIAQLAKQLLEVKKTFTKANSKPRSEEK